MNYSILNELSQHDYHIHTCYSDGEDTIDACFKAALCTGIKEIAFTDHIWKTSNWVDEYVKEIKLLRDKYPTVKALIGLEAKAIDLDGNVDIREEDLRKIDFLMGVVHRRVTGKTADIVDIAMLSPSNAASVETELTLKMIENPTITIIGHPTRTYYKFFYPDRTKEIFPISYLEKIAKKAKEYNKILEYNTRLPFKQVLLKIYLKHNLPFTIGTDAHKASDVGKFDYIEMDKIIREFGVKNEKS